SSRCADETTTEGRRSEVDRFAERSLRRPLPERRNHGPQGVGGFCHARILAMAGPCPRQGTSHGAPDLLSHDTDRWALHLLPGGWPERRAGASPVARPSLLIADVRASIRPAFRPLSP